MDPAATVAGPRPIPGPVYESAPFSRAVARGTRTRAGIPGPRYWVQHARYTIDATLDVARNRLEGEETVVYLNHSPDSLRQLAVHLRQNVFASGSPRREQVPITGGVTLSRVVVNGQPGAPEPEYVVAGTVMWIRLATPLLPGDSLEFGPPADCTYRNDGATPCRYLVVLVRR